MPFLLPPQEGESILGDVIDADFNPEGSLLQETGRTSTVVDVHDATNAVSGITLALGIVFLVTTAVLYGYYFSTTLDFTDLVVARSLNTGAAESQLEGRSLDSIDSFVPILEDLEIAFAKWGLTTHEDEECRQKLICQALLSTSRSNPEYKSIVEEVSRIMNHVIDMGETQNMDTDRQKKMKGYLKAAKSGLKDDSCDAYLSYCPRFSLRIVDPK